MSTSKTTLALTVLFLALLLASPVVLQAADARRPNVLLIVADDKYD